MPFNSAVGDIMGQNFLGDFVLASALHEDTRYIRRGQEHGLWALAGYAISRSVIRRSDSGAGDIQLVQCGGTATSAAWSNADYSPATRTARVTLVDWGTGVVGSGFANLLPEFWPDIGAWMKRRLGLGHGNTNPAMHARMALQAHT